MDLVKKIRDIPDFPQKGILFRDITPILQDPESLRASVDQIVEKLEKFDFDLIVAPESRGFIFGMPVAYQMKKGFIPIRKAGKLPAEVLKKEYSLEYGTAVIEMHKDAIKPGQKVVLIDDLLATGGTAKAMLEMINDAGGIVSAAVFLIELSALGGKKELEPVPTFSIIRY